MHYPERWGYALFSERQIGSDHADVHLPLAEQIKKYLWLIYYKQMTYRHDHKSYAPNLKALSIVTNQILIDKKAYQFSMKSTSHQFIVTIQQRQTGETWQITHEGLIQKKNAIQS